MNGLDATNLPPTILTTKHPTPISPSDALGSSEPVDREEKEGVDFNYEAHDTRLQKRVADMYAELESLTVQVGTLRRMAPKQGAERLGELLSEDMEKEDAEFQRELDALKEEGTTGAETNLEGGALRLKPLPVGWYEDRKGMYERGTNELAALAGLSGRSVGEVGLCNPSPEFDRDGG